MFHRLEGRLAFPTPPGNSLGATPLSENNSALSFSTTPSHRDGLVSRKSMPHFQQDPQQPLTNLTASSLPKWNESKLSYGLSYVHTSSEDEDVCPTCLEGIRFLASLPISFAGSL